MNLLSFIVPVCCILGIAAVKVSNLPAIITALLVTGIMVLAIYALAGGLSKKQPEQKSSV